MTYYFRIVFALLLTPILTNCGLTSRKEMAQQSIDSVAPPQKTEEIQVQKIPLIKESHVIQKVDFSKRQSESLKKISASIHSIPVEINKDVEKWIHYFTKKDRERFQRFLNRGAQYRDVVESVLRENGLPAELYYLAMIESGYQNHATSVASAVGVWQFIRGTASRYGLAVNSYVDERRDPIRATEAAVRYLRDLHNVFGSWHLAMAGYNAGEYRVVRAVFKGKTRDFWKLVRLKALPPETRNYIPKFLAAVEIGENALKYGFESPRVESYPDIQAVSVPGSLPLAEVAKVAGTSVKEMKSINPHLLRAATPPGGEYQVWVPLRLAKNVENAKALLAKKAKKVRRSIAEDRTNIHRVKRGENLSLIAKKYRMSVAQLKKINGLKSNRILVGKRLKVSSSAKIATKRYRVRRGDNLTKIAQRFGTSVHHLKRLNSIRSNRIYVGQILKVNM